MKEENVPKEISIPVWWHNGNMLINRDALPISHPEHTYNYVKNQLNLIPEDYGVFHPIKEKYKHYTKKQLMSKIIDLENEVESIIHQG